MKKEKFLKFKCRVCEKEGFAEVNLSGLHTQTIIGYDPKLNCLEYGDIVSYADEVVSFQCSNCGVIIENRAGIEITTDEEMIEIIKEHYNE